MSIETEFTEYLGRLLGRPVAPDEALTLTSGQQARAAGWLAERGVAPGGLRARLSSRFTAVGISAETGAIEGANERSWNSRQTEAQAPAHHRSACGRLGIDMQRVDELIPPEALMDPKSSAELTAIFTLREISYAQSRSSPAETLCGLFCAKEALRKCDPALLHLPLTALEILPDEAGRPSFPGYSLSISHSGGFAIAVALGATVDGPYPAR